MIEIQDLRAPWTSKTNIISMVLAIALFAAFRISGGGLGLSSNSRIQNNRDPMFTDEIQTAPGLVQWDDDEDTTSGKVGTVVPAERNNSNNFVVEDDGFDPLAGTGEDSGSEQEEDGGFDEIERELGLR